jgi:hypothetical protein
VREDEKKEKYRFQDCVKQPLVGFFVVVVVAVVDVAFCC